jgi:hypothetical protein
VKRPDQKHVGVLLEPEMYAELEEHRARLDGCRPDGAELTSMGTTVRNLLRRGLDAVKAEEAVGR